MTSPWSIPSAAISSLLRSKLVMIFIFLCWKRLIIKSMAIGGSLMWRNAYLSGVMPMESKTLLMSWKAIHNSLPLLLASSMVLCKIWIGILVFLSGKPLKFGHFSILCFKHKLANRVFITLTVSFLSHSSRIIGLVRSKQNYQSYGFGIGNI